MMFVRPSVCPSVRVSVRPVSVTLFDRRICSIPDLSQFDVITPIIRLNSLKLLETEVQNPKSGFEAVKCIPPPGVPPSLLDLGN